MNLKYIKWTDVFVNSVNRDMSMKFNKILYMNYLATDQ